MLRNGLRKILMLDKNIVIYIYIYEVLRTKIHCNEMKIRDSKQECETNERWSRNSRQTCVTKQGQAVVVVDRFTYLESFLDKDSLAGKATGIVCKMDK